MVGTSRHYTLRQLVEVAATVRRAPDAAMCPIHGNRMTVRVYAVDVNGDGRGFDRLPIPTRFRPAFYAARCDQCATSIQLRAQSEERSHTDPDTRVGERASPSRG
jgi:hypothetical protein